MVPDGLLLGWVTDDSQASFGFSTQASRHAGRPLRPLTYTGDSHLLLCAATGKGKGRGVLIPNALLYKGPLIVVDIKGELYQVTARRRREMGQTVVALDPFGIVTNKSDGLNPLDIFDLPRADPDADAEMLASLLSVGHTSEKDPFWHDTATSFIAGLIANIVDVSPKNERHLGALRDWLFRQNLDYDIAVALDENKVTNRTARDHFVAYLAVSDERTRPCIRATACTYTNALGSPNVVAALSQSTFRLQDVVEGKPLTIYLIVPPDKLDSHKGLLRIWLATLLTAVSRRRHIPKQRTLFLIDECAQLGTLPALRQAVTLHRGAGLQCLTVWQDLSQLRLLYPYDWQTIVNNSEVLQVFGANNHLMATEWAELLGKLPDELLRMAPDQTLVHVQGQGCQICRRPDYLSDDIFVGLYDPNERYALHAKIDTPRNTRRRER